MSAPTRRTVTCRICAEVLPVEINPACTYSEHLEGPAHRLPFQSVMRLVVAWCAA